MAATVHNDLLVKREYEQAYDLARSLLDTTWSDRIEALRVTVPDPDARREQMHIALQSLENLVNESPGCLATLLIRGKPHMRRIMRADCGGTILFDDGGAVYKWRPGGGYILHGGRPAIILVPGRKA